MSERYRVARMGLAAIGLLVGGLVLLMIGGSVLVRGASDLARVAGLSPLVIGLTVVAFGTSAPELAATVTAALRAQGDIAFGNVVGSNIFNVLFILGASAVITPLVVARKLVYVDVPIMIGISLSLVPLGLDGRIGRIEGLLLFGAFLSYVAYSVRAARGEPPATRDAGEHDRGAGNRSTAGGPGRSIALVVAGLVLLVWGSGWLIDGAVAIARALGLSELIIGLTIVAAGTSLPEVATSVLAAWKGERDIAVGNVVGSCIFNIVGVLGLAALVAPGGVTAAQSAMRFDVPVMIASALACLPILFTGHRIQRWEGVVLLGYYAAYVAYLVLDASSHAQLPVFSQVMLRFVLPLTALTLGVVTAREIGRRIGIEAG